MKSEGEGSQARERRLAEQLGEAIFRMNREMLTLSNVNLEEQSGSRLSYLQYQSLVLLSCSGPMRVGDVARALGVSKHSATRICATLTRRFLVSKARMSPDGREVFVSCTSEGTTLVRSVLRRSVDLCQQLADQIPPEYQRALIEAAERFRVAGNAVGAEAGFDWSYWKGDPLDLLEGDPVS